MPKLAKNMYTTAKGERKINCYVVNIPKEVVEKTNLKDKLKLKKYIINKNGNIKGFYIDNNGTIFTHWLNNEEIIILKEKGE